MEGILKRIVAIRKAKKISQKEVSKSLGISQAAYAKFESGTSITIDRLYKIAELLKVSIGDLLDVELPVENNELNEKLIAENEKLKQDLQIQTSLFSAFEMIRDGEILNKNLLKLLQEKDSLIKSFQFIDNELFAKYNQQFIAQNSLIDTFDIECVEKFHNFYGRKAGKEIMKYVDIEKFKKSSTFEFLSSFWEGDGNWSKERIIEWAQEERKKLT